MNWLIKLCVRMIAYNYCIESPPSEFYCGLLIPNGLVFFFLKSMNFGEVFYA